MDPPSRSTSLPMHRLDRDLAERLAARTRFLRLVHVHQCTSTQDLAAADQGLEDVVFWSDHQTKGRGRQQRSWVDRDGLDLAVTLAVRLELPRPLALPTLAPLCVLEAVRPALGESAQELRLKWPNDLYFRDQKLAGVLIDADTQLQPTRYRIGIGLNVNSDELPTELGDRATSMRRISGTQHDRHEILFRLVAAFEDAFAAISRDRTGDLEARYREALGLMGRRVRVRAGQEAVGTLVRLDLDGLELDDGTVVPLEIVQQLQPD